MKKRYLLFTCLLISILFLSGCDPVQDAVDFIESLFTDFFPSIWCWFVSILAAAFNAAGHFMTLIVQPLLSALPDYELPSVNLNDVPFLTYAAYFIPISEGAILVKYLLLFYTSWFIGRVVLRVLKVIR